MRVKTECIGCGQCVTFCPRRAISVCVNAYIGDRCTNCGVCAAYCPVSAIGVDS